MTCQELRVCLGAHLDGELTLERSLAVDEHLAFCMECQWAYAKERELRTLLQTRFPRDPAPEGLRGRIRVAVRRSDLRKRWLAPRRLLGWAVPVAALLVVAVRITLWERNAPPPVVNELVAKHLMYSRLDAPAEVVSASREAVSGWFKGRVRFDVVVPDFSPSGIRLVGGRFSDLSDRPVAYLLYEKGRSLVSLFVFSNRELALPARGWGADRGRSVLRDGGQGHRSGPLEPGRAGLCARVLAGPGGAARVRRYRLAARSLRQDAWCLTLA